MTQKEISEAFTEQPIPIGSIRIPRWGKIGKILRVYKRIELEISTIPIGKVQLIGAHLVGMVGASGIAGLSQSDQINTLLNKNVYPLINIIALAVTPGRELPSKFLIDAIAKQMSMKQLEIAINQVYRRLDLTPFFDILNLTKSLSLSLFPDQEVHGEAS